jgi:uncharacterized repeat protein (TIGR01451 family)
MNTSASGRSGRRIGDFLSIMILVTMAMLVAAPGTSEAKTQLWLYPESDGPREGGHVVTDGMFTLIVENRGTKDGDTASDVSLVVAVNDKTLLGGVTLVWPDGEETLIVAADLQHSTPTLPCDGKEIPRHSVYPADFTTVLVRNIDSINEIEPGESVEIEVEVVGDDGLKVHFDAIATGHKVKKETVVCYGVVNPPGHDVTVVLGDTGDSECPALTINKFASTTSVEIDGEVEYVIEVENTGDCEVTNLLITEDIPTVTDPESGDPVPAFTVDPATVSPEPESQTDDLITWNLASLLPGETATFTLTAVFGQPLADDHEVVNTACVAAEGIEDSLCSSVEVAVGEEAGDGEIGGPGFWCHQIRFALEGRHNATYTVDEFEAFLAEINDGTGSSDESLVFSELYDTSSLELFNTSTLELAQTILCTPLLAESAADRLARHLLTLWFNIVSERIDPDLTLDELCPGDEKLLEDADGGMTVGEVVLGAEEELLADEPDDALLDWWKDIIDFINNATVGSDCDEDDESVSGRLRRSRSRQGGGRLGHH